MVRNLFSTGSLGAEGPNAGLVSHPAATVAGRGGYQSKSRHASHEARRILDPKETSNNRAHFDHPVGKGEPWHMRLSTLVAALMLAATS
jgi:hypothetical protein